MNNYFIGFFKQIQKTEKRWNFVKTLNLNNQDQLLWLAKISNYIKVTDNNKSLIIIVITFYLECFFNNEISFFFTFLHFPKNNWFILKKWALLSFEAWHYFFCIPGNFKYINTSSYNGFIKLSILGITYK